MKNQLNEVKRMQQLAGIITENKLNEIVDFPELEDEFEGAMQTGDYTEEEYFQTILDASPEEILSDDYWEILNAVTQEIYTEEEAVKLAKKWAEEKLANL